MDMMHHSWSLTIRVIVISLFIGGASGVLATALTSNYLWQYALELSELTEPLRLTTEQPRAIPQGYADALTTLESDVLPAVGVLFGTVIPLTGLTKEDEHGTVVALTSDGWMLSASGSLSSVVAIQDKTCLVDEMRVHPITGLSFLHCELDNVSVVDLADEYSLALGDQVFVVEGPDAVVFTEVRGVHWAVENVRSSDVPTRRITLSFEGELRAGSPVFTIFGELVGFVDPTQETAFVVPFEQVASTFKQVLEGEDEIFSPRLGVNAIDLSRTVGLSEALTRGITSGALLFGSQAVERGSSASAAGLLAGDIILSVDGESIGDAYTLDDLIARFSPGDTLMLVIDREGTRLEVSVILGSLSE
jgi:serine protease Do